MNLYLAIACMLFGIVIHFLIVLTAAEDAGQKLTPVGYLREHPYRAALMVCASLVAVLIANELHQLTPLTAVLIGVACQDQADRIRQRANSRITAILEKDNASQP